MLGNKKLNNSVHLDKTILVCDDDQGILEVIKIILEQNNFKVVTLSNPSGIYKKIVKIKPQLIFLDIWMSGFDGGEIAQQLKSEPSTKDIPIVLVSAKNDGAQIAQRTKVDGFIAKPFDILDLVNTAKRLII